jgi:hypothetical protein
MNELQKAKQAHKEKFGKEPSIIGMWWSDPDRLIENIEKAVETGEEYDEYKLLSKEDQKLYDDGMLLF